ncbi:outer membrane protein [Pseudoponticoccus marisrubri]|uniref:Outer membrane protein beta-barrel domain-containing protein n=1 Tax=Pseudoponticoccus marisrubri TaxID=1685382 RepID=A0A0W7WLZ6_9RHOB|nr:porin [Pseudoponticoccus marisrubri]KUF11559.1 hypothetical protein AVJ23_07310 [Pseudoponticoccus marisrubri]
MKRSMIALIAAFGTTGVAATAGTLEMPATDPAPVAPAPVATVTPTSDWTGVYGGLSFGNLEVTAPAQREDERSFGGFVGYDYDFGDFVVGGEYEFQDGGDLTVQGVDVENVQRLKLRGGYDFGETLVYATAGAARVDTSIGDSTGPFGGVGVEYRVTDRFSVGGEALTHSFDDVGGTGVDVDANTFNLRGTLRF